MLVLSACGGDAPTGQDCVLSSDCPSPQICLSGRCQSPAGPRDATMPFPTLDAGPAPSRDAGSFDAGPCGSALTCDAADAECGAVEDGCGAFIDCGDCPEGQTCGGGGTPNRCGGGTCTPASCESLGAQCGKIGDGCRGILECGTCATGHVCNGNACLCTPKTCEELGANCGDPDDGCGTPLSCGVCTAPDRCGANAPNQCGCKLESRTDTTYLPFRTARHASPGSGFLPWELVNRAASLDGFGAYISVRGSCRKIEEEQHGCRCCASDTSTTRTSWDLQLSNPDLTGKLPADAIIRGVEVSVRALGGNGKLAKLALTGNGWASASRVRNIALGGSYKNFFFGGPNDLWGRSWTAADFQDPAFRLNLRMSATATCRQGATSCGTSTVGVDVTRVLVHYQLCR